MKPNKKQKSPRAILLGKLFSTAKEKGISQEMVRETIAQEVNGKRLSQSSANEIGKVIDHITGQTRPRQYGAGIAGLRHEVKDLAMSRWGATWEDSLNAFCREFGVDHYRFLDLRHGKAVKKRLRELNRDRQDGQDERPSR